MAKINVELNAFYGYGCGGCGYGSNENIEIEVSDIELEALRKIGSDKISCKEIVSTIENGDTTLQSLHEQLEEKYYYMVEEYWLYEAYNECLYESLEEHIDQDIKDGLFIPGISLYEDESDYPNYANNEEEEESDEEGNDCHDDTVYKVHNVEVFDELSTTGDTCTYKEENKTELTEELECCLCGHNVNLADS